MTKNHNNRETRIHAALRKIRDMWADLVSWVYTEILIAAWARVVSSDSSALDDFIESSRLADDRTFEPAA